MISGQFGEAAYPRGEAPEVRVGETECVVDLLESTPSRVVCVLAPLTAADLDGQTGEFAQSDGVHAARARDRHGGHGRDLQPGELRVPGHP